MNSTDLLRKRLAKLLSDNMGKKTGQLFNDFYKDDGVESLTDGARAILENYMGPEMAAKKIEEATKDL